MGPSREHIVLPYRHGDALRGGTGKATGWGSGPGRVSPAGHGGRVEGGSRGGAWGPAHPGGPCPALCPSVNEALAAPAASPLPRPPGRV